MPLLSRNTTHLNSSAMSADSVPPFPTPAASVKAAKVLFGDQYDDYVGWQCCARNSSFVTLYGSAADQRKAARSLDWCGGYGQFPTLEQYKLFKEFLKSSRKLARSASEIAQSTLVRTSGCQHPIHPGTPEQDLEFCPVCIVRDICDSLQRITKLWTPLGGIQGPGENCRRKFFNSACEAALYARLLKLWSFEKVRWADSLERYETWTCNEAVWDAEYCKEHRCSDRELPSYVREVHNNWSSMQACISAWDNCPYPKPGVDLDFIVGSKMGGSGLQAAAGRPSSVNSERPLDAHTFPALAPDDISTPATDWLSLFADYSPPRDVVNRSSDVPPSPPPTPPLTSGSSLPDHVPAALRFKENDISPSSDAGELQEQVIKKVTFSAEVIEGPYRRRGAYHRRSLSYRPGKYSSLEKKWLDTSLKNDEDSSDNDSSESDDSDADSCETNEDSDDSRAGEKETAALDPNSREILLNIARLGECFEPRPAPSAGDRRRSVSSKTVRSQVQSWLAGLAVTAPLDREKRGGGDEETIHSRKRGREDHFDPLHERDPSPSRKKRSKTAFHASGDGEVRSEVPSEFIMAVQSSH
ncbi:hypothetical protein BDV96DRAFT_668599 [Lophiotrema nucula]|uniref:Uncharacterized protein n=1 Tax=Lophiotrema nucula TaxID=690887 RepID=A0A6A5YUB1_9PLEO|nr:hypothetical protein BDV96DRAFT_668599 [Lophiotrema nucula]